MPGTTKRSPCSVPTFLPQCLLIALIYPCGVLAVLFIVLLWLISNVKLAFVKLYVKLRTGKSFEILSGMDALNMCASPVYFTDPWCDKTISGVLTFKGKIDVDNLRKRVRERLIDSKERSGAKKYPKLAQRAVRQFGYYAWVDDQEDEGFLSENKVRLHDKSYTDDQSLLQCMREISKIPLSKHHSPWEFVVVPKTPTNEGGSDAYAVMFRFHHSLSDGVGIVLIGTDIVDQAESNVIEDFKKKEEREPPPTIRYNPLIRYLGNPRAKVTPRTAAAIAFNAFKILFMFPWHVMAPVLYKKETNALNLPVSVQSGYKLLASSGILRLQQFKDIAAKCNCSVNDVYLHCLTGTLQRCNAKSHLRADPCVRVFVPMFFLRPRTSWSQNGLTFIITSLPVSNDNGAERLKDIARICQKAKSSTEAVSNFLLAQLMGNHFPLALASYLSKTQVSYTLMATNLQCPFSDFTLLGGQLIDAFFIPQNTCNNAVSFSLMSLKEQMRVIVTVDRIVSPHDSIAQQLVDDFEDELETLHETCMTSY